MLLLEPNKYDKMEEHIENTLKVIRNCESSPFVGGVIIALRGLVEYKIQDDGLKFDDKLDSNVDVFAFNNKLYDMNICKFRDILPSDYISTSTNYTLNDSKPEDIKYIETCLRNFHSTRIDGKKDTDGDNMYQYMLYCIVGALWGDNSKCPFFHIYTGEGSNGKSYLFKLIRQVFGGYYMTLNNATVTIQVKNLNQNSDLDNIKGKRIVVFNEPPEGSKIQVGVFKEITDDQLTTKGMYKDPTTFYAQCKMFGLCNKLPHLSGTDGGTIRRVRVTPFNNTFIDNYDKKTALPHQRPKDNDLDMKLKTDKYRDAFMNLLIQYFPEVKKCLLEGKFDSLCPDICKEKTKNYLKQSNPVIEWINNTYITVNDYDEKIQDVLAKEYFTELKTNYYSINKSCYIGKTEMFNLYLKERSIQLKMKRNEFLKEVSKIFKEKRLKNKIFDCEIYMGVKSIDCISGNDSDDDEDSTNSTIESVV